jgi:phospholipid/cholesterol/gamma-HCH transport system substrate-binding protein
LKRAIRLNLSHGVFAPVARMSDIQIQPQPVAIARVFFVFVVSAVIVLILAWLLTGGGGEIFEPKSDLHSYMQDASGLIKEAAVQLNGIQIGKINDIKLSGLSDQKKVVVIEMKVKSRYLSAIPVDSTVTITADDLLGDKYLNIKRGHATETAGPGAELHSVLPIGDQFNSADLVAAMKDMLNRIDAALKQIEDSSTPIGQFVQTEDMYNKIRAELVSVQQTVQKFAHPQSDFGKMLFTDEFYQQIRAPIIAIDKNLADMQAGERAAGHFVASSEQYDTTRKELADIRNSLAQINAGQGAMGQFTHSDATYRQIQRLVKTLGEAVDSLGASALLSDSQLYESLTGSSTEFREFLGDFRANPRKYLRMKVF